MASRYWVNGTGSWDAATTTHWSASAPITFTASCSGTALTTTGGPALVNGMTVWNNAGTSLGTITGGSGDSWTVSIGGTATSQTMSAATTGASVPTTTDDVFFATGSNTGTYTVTVSVSTGANVNNFSATGPVTGQLKLSWNGANFLNVYGNHFISGNVIYDTVGGLAISSGNITLKGTTTGLTFDTGNLQNAPALYMAGTGTYTLANNYNGDQTASRGSFQINTGTFDTANYAMSAKYYFFSSNPGPSKTFLGRNSNIICTDNAGTGWLASGDAGLTLTLANANVIFTGANVLFDSGNYSYGNVTANSTALARLQITNSTNANINYLTITPRAASGLASVEIGSGSGSMSINNISILSGTDASMRTKLVGSQSIFGGSVPIIYSNGSVALTNVDFGAIDIRGTTTPWTGNSLGNAGGTANVTFTASKTVYSVATANANWSANNYSTTQGGTADANAFPLPQDTLIFDATHPPAGNVITFNANYFVGNINTSARTTNSVTFACGANSITLTGNVTLSANTLFTATGSGGLTLAPGGSSNITTGGSTLPSTLVKGGNGNITLNDNMNVANGVQFYSGNIILNNNIMNCATFLAGAFTPSHTIDFGTSGAINVFSGNTTVWTTQNTSGFIVIGNTKVNLTYSGSTGSRQISTAPLGIGTMSEANVPSFNVTAGSDTVFIVAGNAVRDLNFTGFSGNWQLQSSQYAYGNLTLSSTMNAPTTNGNLTLIGGNSVLGTSRTITTNGKVGNLGLVLSYTNGTGITVALQDDYISNPAAGNGITINTGTLNLNNRNANVPSITVSSSNVKGINFGTGNVNVFGGGSSFNMTKANTTISGNGNLLMSNTTTAKSFSGGDAVYGIKLYQAGAANLTILGNNTFDTLGSRVVNCNIIFQATTTTTISNNFSISGTAGNLITLKSAVNGSKFKLSKASGIVGVDYLSISDSNATGGAGWYAGLNSANTANNVGWIFTAAPVPGCVIEGGILIDTSTGGITFSS